MPTNLVADALLAPASAGDTATVVEIPTAAAVYTQDDGLDLFLTDSRHEAEMAVSRYLEEHYLDVLPHEYQIDFLRRLLASNWGKAIEVFSQGAREAGYTFEYALQEL